MAGEEHWDWGSFWDLGFLDINVHLIILNSIHIFILIKSNSILSSERHVLELLVRLVLLWLCFFLAGGRLWDLGLRSRGGEGATTSSSSVSESSLDAASQSLCGSLQSVKNTQAIIR